MFQYDSRSAYHLIDLEAVQCFIVRTFYRSLDIISTNNKVALIRTGDTQLGSRDVMYERKF